MAQTLLAGYPQNVGAKVEAILRVDGPTSYPTGGQTIDARACGMTYIEFISGGASSNGTYQTEGRATGIATTQKLMWITASSGAEVSNATNLSASSAVILVRGFL